MTTRNAAKNDSVETVTEDATENAVVESVDEKFARLWVEHESAVNDILAQYEARLQHLETSEEHTRFCVNRDK